MWACNSAIELNQAGASGRSASIVTWSIEACGIVNEMMTLHLLTFTLVASLYLLILSSLTTIDFANSDHREPAFL